MKSLNQTTFIINPWNRH